MTCATPVKIHPSTKLRVGSKTSVNILLGGFFLDKFKKPGFPSYPLNLATIGNYLYFADRTIQIAPRIMEGLKSTYCKGRLKESCCVEKIKKNKFNCLERH